MAKSKWECGVCEESFALKEKLIEHLMEEADEADDIVNRIAFQLGELGVED